MWQTGRPNCPNESVRDGIRRKNGMTFYDEGASSWRNGAGKVLKAEAERPCPWMLKGESISACMLCRLLVRGDCMCREVSSNHDSNWGLDALGQGRASPGGLKTASILHTLARVPMEDKRQHYEPLHS